MWRHIAFTESIYLRPVLDSFILAVSVATIAALLGTPLAWLIARTSLPGLKGLRAFITAAFVTPSFIGAETWTLARHAEERWVNCAIVSLRTPSTARSTSSPLMVQRRILGRRKFIVVGGKGGGAG